MQTTGASKSSETKQLAGPGSSPGQSIMASTGPGLSAAAAGRWTRAHRCLLLLALVVLVVAGQGQHFFYDEWAFVGGKLDALPLTDRYLLPHNEHWTMLPHLAYGTLVAAVGIGSYWPFLTLLLVLHLGATHVLWRLMIVTGSKPIVATALAAIFSVLGAAAENLVWAFQIAFVGSTLLGLSAVYLAVTGNTSWRKTALVACLTLAGLATSGVGLTYLIVVPLIYTWRQRQKGAVVLVLPLLVYIMWYAGYGHAPTNPPEASAALPLLVGAFTVLGLVSALTGYFGFAMNNPVPYLVVGAPLLTAIIIACRRWLADRTLAGRTHLAMCLGSVAFFASAGLARGGFGLEMATSSRYVYVCMALLLPAIAVILSRGTDRHRLMMRAFLPAAIAVAVSNIFQLMSFAAETRHENDTSRRVLMAGSDLVRSSSPIFADQRPEPLLAPDLTTRDLLSGHLDPAFKNVFPGPTDRLTSSLNLQIRVSAARGQDAASPCRSTLGPRISVPISRESTPRFLVSAAARVTFTLHDAGSGSAQRMSVLSKGTYQVTSVRNPGDLTIMTQDRSPLLAIC